MTTFLTHFQLRKEWSDLSAKREDCFLRRHYAKAEDLSLHSKHLSPLHIGDNVYIQDQSGNTPKKWNKSGTVLECLPHDSFLVKVDGSGNVTKRNRKFLRKFTPFNRSHEHMSQPGGIPLLAVQPDPPRVDQGPQTQEIEDRSPYQAQPQPSSPTLTTPIKLMRKPIKERWIVNPDYPSKTGTAATGQHKSTTAQGPQTDPAGHAPGGGHREDQDTKTLDLSYSSFGKASQLSHLYHSS